MKGIKILSGAVLAAFIAGAFAGCSFLMGGGSSSDGSADSTPTDSSNTSAVCTHSGAQRHAAVSASCETAGNLEYWECPSCETKFKDEALTQKYTDDSYVVAAGHEYALGVCKACGEVATAESFAETTWKITEVTGRYNNGASLQPSLETMLSTFSGEIMGTEYVLYEDEIDGYVYEGEDADDKVQISGTVGVKTKTGGEMEQGVWGQRGNYVWIQLGGEGYESYERQSIGCYLEDGKLVCEWYFDVSEMPDELPDSQHDRYAQDFNAMIYLTKRS